MGAEPPTKDENDTLSCGPQHPVGRRLAGGRGARTYAWRDAGPLSRANVQADITSTASRHTLRTSKAAPFVDEYVEDKRSRRR